MRLYLLFIAQILLLILCGGGVFAEPASETLIIAGDGGRLDPRMSEVLKDWFIKSAKDRSVVFLGDNVYPSGVPAVDNVQSYKQASDILNLQIKPAKETSSGFIFIPGNHDWNDSKEGGWKAIKRQENLIRELSGSDGHFYPQNGCPGPVRVKVSEHIQLILFDTEWLLHSGSKPSKLEDGCVAISPEEMKEEFIKIFKSTAPGVISVFATHHPLKSHGAHAFSERCPQKGRCPEQIEMRKLLEECLAPFNNLICAGGHDHGLQIIKPEKGEICGLYVVSGAISDTVDISPEKSSLYSSMSRGFLKLDRNADGNFTLSAIAVKYTGNKSYKSEKAFKIRLKPDTKHFSFD